MEVPYATLYLGWHKLENEILKEAKKAQKWHFWVSKWSFLVIYMVFNLFQNFIFQLAAP